MRKIGKSVFTPKQFRSKLKNYLKTIIILSTKKNKNTEIYENTLYFVDSLDKFIKYLKNHFKNSSQNYPSCQRYLKFNSDPD